jgi:hypothetical protein
MCSLPVPKQFEENLGSKNSFAQSATCRTWQPALRLIPMFWLFPYQEKVLLCSRGLHEILLSAFDRQHVADHLPGYCKVARLGFPLSNSRARIIASSGDSLAASTSTRWICLLRCFDSGIRIILSAELFSSAHKPQ